MKRIFSIILCILLLASFLCMPTFATDSEEFIKNGGFEIANADGTPAGWITAPDKAPYSLDYKIRAKEGKASLKHETAAANTYVAQEITHLVGGGECTFSFWVKIDSYQDAPPSWKIEFYQMENGKKTYMDDIRYGNLDTLPNGKWAQMKTTIAVPANAFSANILLRAPGSNVLIHWDKVSFVGKRAEGYIDTPLEVSTEPEKPVTEKPQISEEPAYKLAESKTREFVKNGGFEERNDDVKGFKSWNFGNPAYQSASVIETENPHLGNGAVVLKSENAAGVYVTQQLTGMLGNAEYKFTAFVRSRNLPANCYPVVKFEYYKKNAAGGTESAGEESIKFLNAKLDGTWEKWEFTVTSPPETIMANLLLRVTFQGGEVAFDDASVEGAHQLDYPVKLDPSLFPASSYKDMPIGAEELCSNCSFEETDENGFPAGGWTPYKESWASQQNVQLSTDRAHSGTNSIKIETDEANNPWVRFFVPDVQPLTKYQVSAWISSSYFSGKGIAYKLEYYSSNEPSNDTYLQSISGETEYISFITGEDWYHYAQTFTVPDSAVSARIYIRLYAEGTVYVDDVSCFVLSPPEAVSLSADETFYYTQTLKGKAIATPNLKVYPTLADGTVDFSLEYNGTVVSEKKNAALRDGVAEFIFYMDDMKEKQKEYTLTALIKDANGTPFGSDSVPVYKFDRPTAIAEDGSFIKADGTRLDVIYAYHLPSELTDEVNKMGINVVQAWPSKERLDELSANNLMGIVALYPDMKAAGSSINMAKTIATVNQFKDHPAVFAWAIMDEPFANDKFIEPDLINSYKIIREIDPVHPIWVMEDGANNAAAAKYCDIFGMDPYPGNHGDIPTTSQAEKIHAAQTAINYEKPVYYLAQAFSFNGYSPTPDEMRNMIYQAYFERVRAVGYYAFDVSIDGKPLPKTDIYEPLCEWYEKEHKDMIDYFSYGEYPTFNIVRSDDFWEESFVRDGKIHMFVQNRRQKENTNVNIPLISYDGKVSIASFSAIEYCGAEGNTFSGNGNLSVTLMPGQAVQYVITPDINSDFSGLKASKFGDMGQHIWAKSAVVNLEEKGIIEGISTYAFGPGMSVTRGDFAAYLIRTLGLTADTTDTFSDVRKNETYAKEIAIGKALGILQGMGDNMYCPEEKITRQDLMTIVARGMKCAGVLDENTNADALTYFSDNAIISDYARSAMAAMVQNGIIRGNADSTLNPMGFATRAEAAVMMDRIIK